MKQKKFDIFLEAVLQAGAITLIATAIGTAVGGPAGTAIGIKVGSFLSTRNALISGSTPVIPFSNWNLYKQGLGGWV